MARLELTSVCRPLSRPLTNARARYASRESLLVELKTEDGLVGQGEASPLPGYSRDTLNDCKRELERLREGRLPEIDLSQVLPTLREWGARLDAAAARFAVETALLDLIGQRLALPLFRLLGGVDAPAPVPLAALIDVLDEEEALTAARAALADGISTFKVKVGRSFDTEVKLVRRLRRELGAGVAIRLDANGAWSAEEAAARLPAFRDSLPELIEEPCKQWQADLRSPIPIALDETLQQENAEAIVRQLAAAGRCHAIVLKPMALGGFLRCLELAAVAAALGIGVIVTHLFDGPLALAAAAELALALGPVPWACGLRSHAGLSAWPAAGIPQIDKDRIVPRRLSGLGVKLTTPFKDPLHD